MNMNTFKYKKDRNFVELVGTVSNMPEFPKYIPRPLVGFNLSSQRRRKSEDQNIIKDNNRIICFDNENIVDEVKDGDRIKVKGELQSRNFTRDDHPFNDMISVAVETYLDVWEELPCAKQPNGKIREPIVWSKLTELSLLPEERIPADSIFGLDGSKVKNDERQYVYRVDQYGEVYKESEHTAYEVVTSDIEIIEEEMDPLEGDKNFVIIVGEVSKNPIIQNLGEKNIPFFRMNVKTDSEFFPGRFFFNNVISWAHIAESCRQNLNKGDLVKVIGRLQSREFEKEVRLRWVTEHGNKKTALKTYPFTTREVSASSVKISENRHSHD